MSSVRNRMRQAHTQKPNRQQDVPSLTEKLEESKAFESLGGKEKPNEMTFYDEKDLIEDIENTVDEDIDIEEQPEDDSNDSDDNEKTVRRRNIPETQIIRRRKPPAKKIAGKRPASITSAARKDIPIEYYRYKPKQVNFGIFNRELLDWYNNFSEDNQENGGVALSKSLIAEILLDIVYYDLELDAIGYNSYQELRADIMEKIKRFEG